MEPPPPSPGGRPSTIPWIATAAVTIAAFALTAFLKTCQLGDQGVKVAGKAVAVVETAVEKAPEWAAKFKTGTITHTFTEQVTRIAPTQGDVLEVATIQSTESFVLTDTRRILWDALNLGTTTAEIRCPVTFRYHIRISDPWRLATRENTCVVLAPAIQPSLPPAIHTHQLEKNTRADWLRFNGQENLSALERGITPELVRRAADRKHQALAREACRQAVAAFVKNWLLREEHWREDRFRAVTVVFPDEAGFASDEELAAYKEREPTLVLEQKN